MGDGRGRAGGAGSGTATDVKAKPNDPLGDRDSVDSTVNAKDAKEAARDLGLNAEDAKDFEQGAKATEQALKTNSGSKDPQDLVDSFDRAVKSYERRYGRRAGKAYARGGYWSLLRMIRAGIAVYNIATGAGSAPVVQAANTAILASYCVSRWSK